MPNRGRSGMKFMSAENMGAGRTAVEEEAKRAVGNREEPCRSCFSQ